MSCQVENFPVDFLTANHFTVRGGIRQAAAPKHARLQRILAALPVITRPPPERAPADVRREFEEMVETPG
uniref:Uncharacterized protein n=1 Tax=Ascaris lumbricoides TaxID=6252 RepID=A0A9J2PJ49_ASCLU